MAFLLTFLLVTLLWLLVGGVGPLLIFQFSKSPYRGVWMTMLVSAAICCWLHWFITIMAQLNPLFGPELTRAKIYMLKWEWS